MKTLITTLITLHLFPFISHAKIEVNMNPASGSKVSGVIEINQIKKNKIKITGKISGLLPNGVHGIHIHEHPDCGDNGQMAGGHFSPKGHKHGELKSKKSHAGDLGNIIADINGVADFKKKTKKLSLHKEKKNSIIGKSIIIHGKADDLETQPSGSSGERIACGIIKAAK